MFTPSWVCNAQNNLIDDAWFGRKGVFNEEITKGETAAAAVTDLTAKNENLQAANMALFLKTGKTAATGENEEETAEEENKLEYADLFDEKGELK